MNSSIIDGRIEKLRELMKERNISVYIIPTADYHESEYVGDYFKAREFITGFTGSAGTAVVTLTEANLWTDARYFLQAKEQLSGSEVILRRMGEDNVPTIEAYLRDCLKNKQSDSFNIGFDGKVVNQSDGALYALIASEAGQEVFWDEDLINNIWTDRPGLSEKPLMILDDKYTGETATSKIEKIRHAMKENDADAHIISSLYDIAWILNIRGDDIRYVPVFLSYMIITDSSCLLFIQESQVTDEIKEYLLSINVSILPYESFFDYLKTSDSLKNIMLDERMVSYKTINSLPESANIINQPNPSNLLKAVKNPVEIENTRKAHLKDAVAMCKFMYWIKTNVSNGDTTITEMSASDYLEGLRREQEGFIELSFETICGFNAHGAIIHYAVDENTDIPIENNGLLLVDSGGHYLEGTTDITRTFALGQLSDEMKRDFTLVVRSNLNLANVRFLKGCSGLNLDVIARQPFWEAGKDFKHGTGHGVGHILNVHEGPNAFRWRMSAGRTECTALEEGMITTDEPGLYIEGEYGIRIENELLCRLGQKNEFGQFMYFENLTYVPIDLDAIEPELMTPTEKKYLNEYHREVYDKVSPFLNDEEREFLKEYTREI